MRNTLYTILIFISLISLGQLETGIIPDSVKVGERFDYQVKYTYPASDRIILPDSSSDFEPFECFGVKDYGTISSDSFITDSITYRLATFYLNKYQFFEFELKHCTKTDTTFINGSEDTLKVFLITEGLPLDSLQIKPYSEWVPMNYGPNTRLHLLAGGSLLLFLLLIGFTFWKPLTKRFRSKSIQKKVANALNKLETLSTADRSELGEYLDEFKKILSHVEKHELRSKTNKELAFEFNEKDLTEHLKKLDQIIYNPKSEERMEDTHAFFKAFLLNRLSKRLLAIKNGNE